MMKDLREEIKMGVCITVPKFTNKTKLSPLILNQLQNISALY
jgi:hypothetical protein